MMILTLYLINILSLNITNVLALDIFYTRQ